MCADVQIGTIYRDRIPFMTSSETSILPSRPEITVPALYALLIHEFARVRPAECKRCCVPLPFWGPAPGNKIHWYMPARPICPHGCHQLLSEMWARHSIEFSIQRPEDANAYRPRPARAARSTAGPAATG